MLTTSAGPNETGGPVGVLKYIRCHLCSRNNSRLIYGTGYVGNWNFTRALTFNNCCAAGQVEMGPISSPLTVSKLRLRAVSMMQSMLTTSLALSTIGFLHRTQQQDLQGSK